ncbi:hypothetical protein G7Y89_g5723 [Cudoniella acicularis]|uniref:RlpA-like protein double-psi beta-barrel domain-containing protein n=1 Tax=Cudoniella acicularis TaxID=354080 RepID=A0A8H4RNJ5_9HELO|nr:hypothetical protein G7Y89_g5723 [Cudoniella acicularis]
MATMNHEVPEWETPSSPPKKNIFRKPVAKSQQQPLQTSKEDKELEAGLEMGTSTAAPGFAERVIPRPVKAWLAGNRKRKIIVSAVAGLVLLVFILGLGLGLGLKHKSQENSGSLSTSSSAQDLPLPTNTGIFTGDLTYYSPGPGYGACGYENTSTDAICAISHIVWDAASTSSNPNLNPLCGKKIRITRYDPTRGGNSSVDVEVVDRCVGCQADDLDLSLSMFTSLAEEDQGRVVGSWAWLT